MSKPKPDPLAALRGMRLQAASDHLQAIQSQVILLRGLLMVMVAEEEADAQRKAKKERSTR